MATAQFPKTQNSSKSWESQHKWSCAALLRGADLRRQCSTQVLLVLGLGGDLLVLPNFPPEKLTSPEFSVIEESKPLGLFELLLPTPRVAYAVVSKEQFSVM